MFYLISLIPVSKNLQSLLSSNNEKQSKILVVVLSPQEEIVQEMVPITSCEKFPSKDLMNSENGILRINLSSRNISQQVSQN